MPYYLSRIRVPANTWSITATIDGATHTAYIAAGNYYLDGGSESLVQAVDDCLTTNWAGEAFTCGFSTSTGYIAFACSTLAGTWAVAFDQLAFANWMGFAAAGGGWAAGGSPQVSAIRCAGQIFTGSGRQAFPGIHQRTSGATVISESGVTAHVGSGAFRTFSRWEHGFEAYTGAASPLESGVFAAPASSIWTWRDFWQHHAATGEPFRYFTTSGLGVGAYEDIYVLDGKSYSEFTPTRQEEASDRYWRVGLEVAKYQAAA